MDDNRKMMDSKYIENNDMKTIEENEKFKQNEDMLNRINSVKNNVVHSQPNTSLHRDPLPPKSGLSDLDSKNEKPNTLNKNSNANFAKTQGLGRDDLRKNDLRKEAIKQSNATRNKSFKDRIAKAGLRAAGMPDSAAEKVLESNKSKSLLGQRKGLFGRLFDSLGGSKSKQDVADKASDGGGTYRVSAKAVKVAVFAVLIPVISFLLTLFVSMFVIFAILDNLGLDPDRVMDSSMDTIEKKLDGADVDKDATEGTNKITKELSFSNIAINNSIYSIKLNGANLLVTSIFDKESNKNDGFDFDINSINELYPSASEYGNVQYSYAFFYKLYRLNEYYKSSEVCGKQILDLPLLMITLKQESDNMSDVFASNVGATKDGITIDKAYIETNFVPYFKYDYDWSNYTYSANNSIHDMEILAQHMVKVYGTGYCQYDAEGYKEFLKEFIEKKYYLGSSGGDRLVSNPNSSNYFPKYELTEDQLLQIASLCAQEQGHSRPLGAAAEASLMANKFEIDDEGYIKKYPSSIADAFYHYVRENGWWANAAKFMDKRNASSEIVEAVRSVLIDGYRTLPKYVNSHDCPNCGSDKCSSGKRGDICEVVTNGIKYTTENDVAAREHYVAHHTQIKNVYGNSYRTFYSFPSSAGDPFSYKNPKLREKYGECHYDPEKKMFVDCIDFKNAMVKWAINIAEDNSHGYSQAKRDSGIDYDCSSLVYYSLINNGFTAAQLGGRPFTTRTEQDILKKNGFTEIAVNSDCSNLQFGDILWRNGHTEIYIGEGMTVGAHAASNGTAEDGQQGDQNGKEITVVSIEKNWTYAYRYER